MMQGYDRRTFMVNQNINDSNFMHMIFFSRYMVFGGTVESLVDIKRIEVQRKVEAKEVFTDQTAFDGTRVNSYSKEMESIVWQMTGQNCDNILNSYDRNITQIKELIDAHVEGKSNLPRDKFLCL